MKLRNKLSIITATALASFVGVGFAAWVFGNQATVEQEAVNVITAAVDLQGLTLNKVGFKMVLDQPSKSYNTQGKGIHWEDADGNTITNITLTPVIQYRAGADTPTYEFSFVPAITETSGLNTYVTLSNKDTTERTGTFTQAEPLAAFNYTLPTLAYVDEPDTLAEYDAMVSGMSGKTVNFSFTLNITDNSANA